MFARLSPVALWKVFTSMRPLTWGILCVALSLTTVATYFAFQSLAVETQNRFERASLALSQSFRNRMTIYIYTLTHVRNLLDIDRKLTEKEFQSAIRSLRISEQLPGIQNIGWIERLDAKKVGPRVAELRATRPDFKILPEGARDEYYPITYLKAIEEGASTPYGHDLFVNAERRAAMEQARDTGQPVATERVAPIQPPFNAIAFLVFVPHYRPDMAITTVEERRAALDGFVYAGFRANNFFKRIVDELKEINPIFGIEIHDGPKVTPETLMYSSDPPQEYDPRLQKQVVVLAANHAWTFSIKALRSFNLPSSSRFPLLIFVLGLFTSVAIAYYADRTERHNRRLSEEKQIVELTSKVGTLLKVEEDLERIVQLVTDTATQLTNAKFGAFFYNVPNADGKVLTLYTLSGAPKEAFEKFGHPRATPVFKPTFDGAGIVRSDDITKDSRYGKMAPHHGMPKGHLPVRSYLAAPVISKKGTVMGGLFFGHPEPGVFTEASESTLGAIAIQAAVAMDNANMSHEIRTPLGIIIGFAELAREHVRDDASEAERNLDGIIRNGKELSRIIGEVLDLSKIEAKALQVEETTFSLTKLLEDLQATWSHQASVKGVKLSIETGEGFPARVKSDPTRLRQILMNLTSNAVKFTDEGAVKVTARQKSDGESPVLEFTVEDTGTGISVENQGRLFHAFSQADGSITRKFGGTGLGLVISRELARALNGDLLLDWSEPGNGSRFRFTVPVKKAESTQIAPETPTVSLGGMRVLLVEDSPDNQFLVSMYLEKAGAKVEVAENGERGVALALSREYDAVLMDIQMPVLDGYGALERLKKAGYQKPVLALTAHAMKEERDRALALGFADYLTKPIDRGVLLRSLGSRTLSQAKV